MWDVGNMARLPESASEHVSMHAEFLGTFVGVRVQFKSEPFSLLLFFKTTHSFVSKAIELFFLVHGLIAKVVEFFLLFLDGLPPPLLPRMVFSLRVWSAC